MSNRQIPPAENSRRALYNKLQDKYPGKVVTDSYLLLQACIQSVTNTVKFPVLTNETLNSIPTSVVEVRLDITDRFCAFDWALMIRKAGSSAVNQATPAEMAYSIPLTYPNSAVFTASNEARNLEALYNGNLKVTIDSDVYYQAYPCRNFYRVPTSQKGVTTSSFTGTPPTQYLIPDDGWDSMNYSFATVTPNFEFSGIGKNVVELTIPAPSSMAGTSSQNYVDLVVRGFLIQNVNQKR